MTHREDPSASFQPGELVMVTRWEYASIYDIMEAYPHMRPWRNNASYSMPPAAAMFLSSVLRWAVVLVGLHAVRIETVGLEKMR